jgi:hypothetical protein
MLNKYPSILSPKWFFVSLKHALFAKKDWIYKKIGCPIPQRVPCFRFFFLRFELRKEKVIKEKTSRFYQQYGGKKESA